LLILFKHHNIQVFTAQMKDIIFQCCTVLTVNYSFVISRNKCNNLCHHPWHNNIEYVLICLILRSDQNIDTSAWCQAIYTMFPGNIVHVMPCSLGTWRCTDKTRQHCLFLQITWRALDQSQSLVIQIVWPAVCVLTTHIYQHIHIRLCKVLLLLLYQ